MSKVCKSDQILNQSTNRCVKKSGKIGKKIQSQLRSKSKPKDAPVSKSKPKPVSKSKPKPVSKSKPKPVSKSKAKKLIVGSNCNDNSQCYTKCCLNNKCSSISKCVNKTLPKKLSQTYNVVNRITSIDELLIIKKKWYIEFKNQPMDQYCKYFKSEFQPGNPIRSNIMGKSKYVPCMSNHYNENNINKKHGIYFCTDDNNDVNDESQIAKNCASKKKPNCISINTNNLKDFLDNNMYDYNQELWHFTETNDIDVNKRYIKDRRKRFIGNLEFKDGLPFKSIEKERNKINTIIKNYDYKRLVINELPILHFSGITHELSDTNGSPIYVLLFERLLHSEGIDIGKLFALNFFLRTLCNCKIGAFYIYTLMVKYFYDKNNLKSIYITDKDDNVLGFAIYQLNIQPNEAMLHLICTDGTVSGLNIGEKILSECEKRSKKSGMKYMYLDSVSASIKFYEKNGYNESPSPEIKYGLEPDNSNLMFKKI